MNSEPLPKWMMRRYSMLWNKINDDEFNLDSAAEILKEDKKVILVLLSNLRKMGWMTVEFDEDDARKRKYKLKEPQLVVEMMADDY